MPEKMLVLAVVLGVAQLALNVETTAADFAFLVIAYTVAATGARWASRLALAVGLCAAPWRNCAGGTTTRARWATSRK